MSESDSNDEERSTEDELSESSSSEDEAVVDISQDKNYFITLACIKNNDPRIYDKNYDFYPKSSDNKNQKHVDKSKKHKEKSVFVKDYVVKYEEENTEEKDEPLNNAEVVRGITECLKRETMISHDAGSDSDDDQLFKLEKGGKKDRTNNNKPDDDYIEFLKGNKDELKDKQLESELKPFHDLMKENKFDPAEKYVINYLLSYDYLNEDKPITNDENLSEDERDVEKQELFEHNYNNRYETEDNLQLRRYPRQIDGSLRRKDNSRKRKRTEVAQRKKEEKKKKFQEIKKKQKEKLSVIEERMKKIQEASGNTKLGFDNDIFLDDFDPEKYDKKMNELFNQDYYNEVEEERPVFNDEDCEGWEYDDNNMDCEANSPTGLTKKEKKLTRSKKKKLLKKKDVMNVVKPSFDPSVHNDFDQYLDEYYNLDCEDFIDDLPCRFKYRQVVPNDFGLTVEEILKADDSELNQWAPLSKINRRRAEHVEKNEVKIYSKKAKDEYLKKKILSSLYSEENDDQQLEGSSNLGFEQKSKKRKRNSEDVSQIQYEAPSDNLVEVSVKQEHDTDEAVVMKVKKKKLGDSLSKNDDKEGCASSQSNSSNKKKLKNKGKLSVPPPENQQTNGNPEVSENNKKNKNKRFNRRNANTNNHNKGEVTELSDNRLLAYGLKPKQFRAKLKYAPKKF